MFRKAMQGFIYDYINKHINEYIRKNIYIYIYIHTSKQCMCVYIYMGLWVDTAYNVGALIIRKGFWGPLYYNYNKEPPQNSIGNYLGPHPKPP